MGVAIAALTVLTLIALIVGPYGRWDDPYVSVSMFWSVVALARLLAMLSVVWSPAPSLQDPKLGVRCTNEHPLVLVSRSREIWLAGWWIGEDRIVPPGKATRCRPGVSCSTVAAGVFPFPPRSGRAGARVHER
jgi:hypothetical protein